MSTKQDYEKDHNERISKLLDEYDRDKVNLHLLRLETKNRELGPYANHYDIQSEAAIKYLMAIIGQLQ